MHDATQQVPDIIQAFVPIVNSYGYLAVGILILVEDFGVPAPGETVLIASAFFAGLGHLDIFLVILIAFLAAVIGDNIGFAIGKYGGHSLVNRFGKYVLITPTRLNRLEEFFHRHGGKIIVFARFIDGLRQLNGIVAGLSKMKWKHFLTYNVIGAALWVCLWALIGYYGGSHIDIFLRYQLYFTIIVFIAIAGFISWKILKHRKHPSQ